MPIEHINKTDTLNEGREKLNNAITAFNETVVEGDSSVEAAQARVDEKGVPHPTLKARIDDGFEKTNQQLAQKASRYEVFLKQNGININDLDEETRQAILENNSIDINYVLGKDNVKNINLADYTVSPKKATFFESTKNLYHGDLVDGFVYGTDNGGGIVDGEFGSDGTAKSCIIKVEPGESYTITSYGGNRRRYAVYESYPEFGDEPIELIESMMSGGDSSGSSKTFTNPPKANYLAVFLSTEGVDVKCQVEKGSNSTEYELPYKFNSELLGEFSGSKIKNTSIAKEKTDFILKTKNLYHGDLVRGFVYDQDDPSSGQFGDDADAKSCIIEVIPNETYTITPYGGNRKIYAVYEYYPNYGDEAVELVNGTNHNSNPVTFTNPSNGNYLVIYLSREGEDVRCQVEKGGNSTEYTVPYKLDQRISSNGTEGSSNISQLEKIKDKFHIYSTFALDYKPLKQEPANEDGEFNAMTALHGAIYDLYDSLMNDNPNYITKKRSGEDRYGNPIYTYTFSPPKPRESESFPIKRLKLLIFSGVHGDERTWPYSLYKMLEEVLTRGGQHEFLDFLRWNVELVVTPIVNPSGYDDSTRLSRSGIDINRNFDAGWDTSVGKGTSPFSELESLAVKKVIDENPDAELLLDYHNYFSPRNHLLWAPLNNNFINKGMPEFISSYFSLTVGKWSNEYSWMPEFDNNKDNLTRVSSEIIPSLASYGVKRGMISHTVEIRDVIPSKPGAKNLDETNVEFAMEFGINIIAGLINTL